MLLTHTHTHTHTHSLAHTHTNTHKHALRAVLISTRVFPGPTQVSLSQHVYAHVYVRACIHTRLHGCEHCCMHSGACMIVLCYFKKQGTVWICVGVRTATHTATHYNTLQHATTHCNTKTMIMLDYDLISLVDGEKRQVAATHCITLQCIATHIWWLLAHDRTSSVVHYRPQHTATHCYTLQHTAAHYHALQHTATHTNKLRCSGVSLVCVSYIVSPSLCVSLCLSHVCLSVSLMRVNYCVCAHSSVSRTCVPLKW